jgi:hypothetical protein
MDQSPRSISKKSNCPANNQNYSDNVQQIAHVDNFKDDLNKAMECKIPARAGKSGFEIPVSLK